MPNFLVEETTVRSGGESQILALGAAASHPLLLTLSISHVVERQNLDVDIYASEDGISWSWKPVATFIQKFSCGTYEMLLPQCEAKFLKAVWKMSRWGRGDDRPLCRFSLRVQDASALEAKLPKRRHAMAGAA